MPCARTCRLYLLPNDCSNTLDFERVVECVCKVNVLQANVVQQSAIETIEQISNVMTNIFRVFDDFWARNGGLKTKLKNFFKDNRKLSYRICYASFLQCRVVSQEAFLILLRNRSVGFNQNVLYASSVLVETVLDEC